ncbi:MAG TPA: phosphoenolpyruvate carboxykinase (GTP), partial [Flavisolibacter sp.]|nr:phosphoenolpyruvate carboxykinase (GTP) [Flavisolibacter sp.]
MLGREEHWLAEPMSIAGVTSPEGRKTYLAAAFPGAGEMSSFSMMVPAKGLDGWKITTVSDDIAWIYPQPDGRLVAINPEAGYFGVVSGINDNTHPNAMETMKANTIFTNVALTQDGDVWWEGLTPEPPEGLTDWQGNAWNDQTGKPAAHPSARFTAPAKQNPAIDLEWDNPGGVPIEGFLFGGRRSTVVPLVYQSFNWSFGVYLAATMGSETATDAFGEKGKLRRDPFTMLPFLGYHIADYLEHWLQFGRELPNAPRMFSVNWFRKNEQGNLLWPGSGENIRVVKWIVERIQGKASSVERAIGWVPRYEDIDWTGLDFSKDDFEKIMDVDPELWKQELLNHEELFSKIYDKIPKEFFFMRVLLLSSLWRSSGTWGLAPELT